MKYLLIILILASCSSASKLRRAEKLIKQAEELGARWHIDTIYRTKEVVVPETHFDTVLKQVNFRDTITVEKERVVTRVKVNTITKEIFIETKCPPDTIKIKIPVTVTKTIKAKGYSLWQLIILALVMLLAGYGVRAFMRR